MGSPPIDILVATCGRPDLLGRMLDSLAASRLPSTLREVLVVENGGRAGADEVCHARGDRLPLRYLYLEQGSKTKALNAGIAALDPGLVWFLDDDVRLGGDAPWAYAEAAARHGAGHYFGGPLHVDRDDEPPGWLRPYLPASACGWFPGEQELTVDRPIFIGSNWAAFRDDVLAVGGYAEHLGPGAETGALGDETELQERLLARGSRGVYVPEAPVWHYVPDDVWSLEWVRRRRYRIGVTRGLLGRERGTEGPWLAGAPLDLWRDCAIRGLAALAARVLGMYPARGLAAEMRFQSSWGALVGTRRLGRGPMPSLPPLLPPPLLEGEHEKRA